MFIRQKLWKLYWLINAFCHSEMAQSSTDDTQGNAEPSDGSKKANDLFRPVHVPINDRLAVRRRLSDFLEDIGYRQVSVSTMSTM